MLDHSSTGGAAIVPERCYRDAPAAMAFIERAFGFAPSLVVPGDAGTILHAELWAGDGCVMLASIAADGPWDYRVPNEIGGTNTGGAYLATSDIGGLYARAVAADCAIVSDLADTEYGSRDFSARDREGFLWHFGTYRPQPDATGEPSPRAEQLYAGMRYADARAAIAWLCRAFGASEHFVVPGEGNEIAHAQLRVSDGLVMLGSARDDHFNMQPPPRIGGAYTETLNVYVPDPDAHHARANAAGATILSAPADTAYGARGYVARDCEGFVWNFSTYRAVRASK